jgi:hypothetical protein
VALLPCSRPTAGHFLLYCDEENGYHVYTESTRTWVKIAMGGGAGQIANVDPDSLTHVVAWKNRLWFTQRDKATGWYLDVGAIYGTAARFDFGNKFKYGGNLVGLWSWTIDGGSGVDDLLVAISSAGDLLIYQGTDPASASTFAMRGTWFLGGVPAGRRIASDFGGDLLVITQLGALPLSKLIGGALNLDPQIYISGKISTLFNDLMNVRKSLTGWEIKLHPTDNAVFVNLPKLAGGEYEQLAMSFVTRGWARLTGLPVACAETWHGSLYFGTADGRVCINTGYVDNNQLAGSTNSTAIPWSVLTSYQNLGTGQIKRVQFIKPMFATDGTAPSFEGEARYDFDLTDPDDVSFASTSTAGTWDSGSWDSAVWGSGQGIAGSNVGSAGMGSNVALAISGSSKAKTTLIGVNVAFDVGGYL